MKKYKFILITFLSILAILNFPLSASADSSARFNFTNESDEETTFMRLRRSLITKMRPQAAQKAKFGIAEYYFKHADFTDAFRAFKEYVKSYPPDASVFLAKIYLYKIAIMWKDAELAAQLKKEAFDQPFVLLFSEFKKLQYKSAFNNIYEIHHYLDNIKVFLNGQVFEEITP